MAVGQVHGVLHARDIGDRQRVNQVLAGDVAEADAADQAVVARLHHRGELVIKSRAGPGVVHEAQIDRGKMVNCQSAQVVLDSLRELGRGIETQHPA